LEIDSTEILAAEMEDMEGPAPVAEA
jgi:hypothetical protein